MIQGVDNLVKWYEINGLPYWIIKADKSKERGKCLFKSTDIENYSITQGKQDFQTAISLLAPGGRYYIECKEDFSANANSRETAYDHIGGSAIASIGSTMQYQQPQQIGLTNEEVEQKIAKALSDAEEKRRIAALEERLRFLEKENKELAKSSSTDKIGAIIDKLEPHLGQILGGFLAPKPVSQPQKPQTMIGNTQQPQVQKALSPEEKQIASDTHRLEVALEKWQRADPEFIAVIEKIANMAHNGEANYAMAKQMLG